MSNDTVGQTTLESKRREEKAERRFRLIAAAFSITFPMLVGYLVGCAVLRQDPFWIHHLINADQRLWGLLFHQ